MYGVSNILNLQREAGHLRLIWQKTNRNMFIQNQNKIEQSINHFVSFIEIRDVIQFCLLKLW